MVASGYKLTLAFCALIIVGCGHSAAAPTSDSNSTLSQHAATQLSDSAKINLAYWTSVNGAFWNASNNAQGKPNKLSLAFRAAATQIQSYRTLGVDPAIVQWALRAATVCEQGAVISDESQASALVLESFLRGANGDPFGAALEHQAAQRQFQANYQMVREEGMRVRAVATTYFGTEFPPCQF
jgi:hypothetical protein